MTISFSRTWRLGLVVAVAAPLVFGGCKQEVQFTRVPVSTATERDTKPNETTVFLAVPINLAQLIATAEKAIGEQIVTSKFPLDDAACDRRKGPWLECMGASIATELTRAGPVDVTVEGNSLLVKVPIKYQISGKGFHWASYLSDSKSGTVTVGVPFDVSLGQGYRLDVKMGQTLVWNEKSVAILQKGRVSFAESRRCQDPRATGGRGRTAAPGHCQPARA